MDNYLIIKKMRNKASSKLTFILDPKDKKTLYRYPPHKTLSEADNIRLLDAMLRIIHQRRIRKLGNILVMDLSEKMSNALLAGRFHSSHDLEAKRLPKEKLKLLIEGRELAVINKNNDSMKAHRELIDYLAELIKKVHNS